MGDGGWTIVHYGDLSARDAFSIQRLRMQTQSLSILFFWDVVCVGLRDVCVKQKKVGLHACMTYEVRCMMQMRKEK